MKTQNPTMRRVFGAIIAAVLVAAIVLTGTYAWQALSNLALNETKGTINPGGRLHDDFDGENKDVYVENFGAAPIFVRVMLSEYMEIGAGAGDPDGTAGKNAVKFDSTSLLADKSSWTPHIPYNGDVTQSAGADVDRYRNYWEWEMGGSKWFMPTFNKDSNSLKTDVTGSESWAAGAAENVKEYKVSDPSGALIGGTNNLSGGNGSHNWFDPSANPGNQFKTTYELLTNGAMSNGTVTHEAKKTRPAEVITMEKWINDGRNQGDFWVVDADGWAYWANPLMPGEATGLLLNKITLKTNPEEDWYYAINVIGQFATKNDLWTNGGFKGPDSGGITKDGEDLLNQIAGGETAEEEDGDEDETPEALLEFAEKEIIKNITVVTAFDSPAVKNKNADDVIAYYSEDEAIAIADAVTGEVTLVGVGEVKIFAEVTDGPNKGQIFYYVLKVVSETDLNYDGLDDAIAEAEEILGGEDKDGLYTQESLDDLEDALDKAKQDREDAQTQQEIDDAEDELRDAIGGLTPLLPARKDPFAPRVESDPELFNGSYVCVEEIPGGGFGYDNTTNELTEEQCYGYIPLNELLMGDASGVTVRSVTGLPAGAGEFKTGAGVDLRTTRFGEVNYEGRDCFIIAWVPASNDGFTFYDNASKYIDVSVVLEQNGKLTNPITVRLVMAGLGF